MASNAVSLGEREEDDYPSQDHALDPLFNVNIIQNTMNKVELVRQSPPLKDKTGWGQKGEQTTPYFPKINRVESKKSNSVDKKN